MYEIKVQYYSRERAIYEMVEEEELGKKVEELMQNQTVQFVAVWRDRGKKRSSAPFSLGGKEQK